MNSGNLTLIPNLLDCSAQTCRRKWRISRDTAYFPAL